MTNNGPARLGDRLFNACITACVAATALYVAVWLLAQIWLWLLGLAVVAAVIAGVRWWRGGRW